MKITPEFAEIIGVYVGDGYLRYKNNCGELDISGSYEEKNYYDNHLIPLFNKTFDAEIKGRYYPHRKTYGFRTSNKDIIKSFKELGFSSGAKSTSVRVPRAIMETDKTKIIAGFLKGYFDTDGCVTFRNRKGGQNYSEFKRKFHYYPRIQLISVSKKLIEDVCILLNKLEIKYYTSTYKPKNINWKQNQKNL